MVLIIENLKVILKTFDKNKISDIFFDLDHTLWDFEKNSELTFKKIFYLMNLKISLNDFLELYRPINHKYWKLYRENKISHYDLRYQRFKLTFLKLNYKIDYSQIIKISDLYIKYLSSFSFLFFGAIDLLDNLIIKYNLHIISNGFENVQKLKIKNSGLDKYFDNIFTSEHIGYKKPDYKIFNYALNKVNVKPESSVMIGDSKEADITGALNVGINAIHFNSNNESLHDLCIIVESLKEIKKFF